jgi:hypothetical protein
MLIDTPRKPAIEPAAPAPRQDPQPATSTDRDPKAEPRKPEDDKRIERFPER